MNTQEIISSGILELYCTGLTSAAETAEVGLWAKQYPEIAAEIAAIQSGLEGYAQTHAIAPAAAVKEKLFTEINKGTTAPVVNLKTTDNGTAKVYAVTSFWKYAAAASIILLAGSLIFNYTYYHKFKTVNDNLQVAQTELQRQKELADAMKGDMDKMADIHAKPVSLEGTDGAARIYWMKNTGDVYIDPTNLPKTPSGMQYQFWAIVDGKPVSGGMITLSDGRIVHLQKMKSFGKAEAFAVSLEEAGPEKPQPSKVVVLGKI